MPVSCRKINGKWRLIEKATGKISMTKSGKPHDGGGHSSEGKCDAQARAINAALHGWKPDK